MYIFIVNPIAGNGKAKKIHERLRMSPEYHALNPTHYYTQYKGHAEELIAQLLDFHHGNITGIIVIGGDGTIHEVVNGSRDWHIPLAFIPGGSGNDFARGLKISGTPLEIMKAFAGNQQSINYWPGNYDVSGIKRSFVNCIGFGFDAVVTKKANHSSLKRVFNSLHMGTLVYVVALLRALFSFSPIPLTIEMDGKVHYFRHCFMVTINNHPYFGGGMKINPLAIHHEKEFSILVIDRIPKWKVFLLFGTVFTGKHLNFKEVKTFHAEQILIKSDVPVAYQADGETGTTMSAVIQKSDFGLQIIDKLAQTTFIKKIKNSSPK